MGEPGLFAVSRLSLIVTRGAHDRAARAHAGAVHGRVLLLIVMFMSVLCVG